MLDKPASQHVLGCLAAVGLSVIAPCVIPPLLGTTVVAGLATAGASAVGSLAGNLLSNALQRRLKDRETDPALPDINHDLLRVMGHAVSAEIGQFARDNASSLGDQLKSVETLARRSDDEFVALFVEEELPGIAPPDAMALLVASSKDKSIPPVGKIEDWETLVRRLVSRCTVVVSPEVESQIASRLHTQLWEAIRRALKRDFADDGKGYAALHIQFMGDVMARLDALAQPTTDRAESETLTREKLEELRKHKQADTDPKAQQIIGKLSGSDKVRLSSLIQRFDQLSAQLDRHFRTLLDEVRAADRASRGRDIITHNRLRWVLVTVSGAAVVGTIAYFVLRAGQTQQFAATIQHTAIVDRVLNDLNSRLDGSELLIKQFLSERPLDSMGKPIIPQLSGELKQRAEELIAKGNKRQRMFAALAMNDLATADRLREELGADIRSERISEDFDLAMFDGNRWHRTGERDKSIPHFELALALRPSDFTARSNAMHSRLYALQGSTDNHLRRVIEIGEGTLKIVKVGSIDWGTTHNYLGHAWSELPTGDRGENLGKAITSLEAALSVFKRDTHPELWETATINLAIAWQYSPSEDRATNLYKAIEAYNIIIQYGSAASLPVVQNNLGEAWREVPTGDRAENLTMSLNAFKAAEALYSLNGDSLRWALTKVNQGGVWADMPGASPEDRYANASLAYREALTILAKETAPTYWATALNNFATLLVQFPVQPREKALNDAIGFFEQVLTVRTKEADPRGWSQTQKNLGDALVQLRDGKINENMALAINAYQNAATVSSESTDPAVWVRLHIAIGNTWIDMPDGEIEARLEKAITAYSTVLTPNTEANAPNEWAAAQNALGLALVNVQNGDRLNNIRNAITAYDAALKRISKEQDAVIWGTLQLNKGIALRALSGLPNQERAPLLLQAITHFENAHSIFTADKFPREHAIVTKQLTLVRQ